VPSNVTVREFGVVGGLMTLKFSVIIPTYERPDLVREAVSSVLAQSVDNFEVVVVDDASRDPVVLPSDPRVRLIVHTEHQGVSAARNTGIDAASGEYVCLLDDDDLFTADWLEIAEEGLGHSPVTVCSKRFVFPGQSDVERSASADVRGFMTSRWLSVGQIAIRRDLAPRFNVELVTAEDHDWAIQVVQRASPYPVDRDGYLARCHTGDHLSGSRTPEEFFHDWELMFSLRSDYFDARPHQLSWQWKLVGGKLLPRDRKLARRAFRHSLRLHPSVRTAYYLFRTWV
jgi:glycosyltransferase involved in cell wall biosynthesis